MNNFFYIILFCMVSSVAARSQMIVFPFSINLPKITKADLDFGYVDTRHSGSHTSIVIDLNDNQSWKLYLDVNSDILFPNELGKRISDVLWKLSDQPDSKYSKLHSDRIFILSGEGSKTINLDYRFDVSWDDIPSEYLLDINYLIEYEDKKRINKKQPSKQEPNFTK
tara:strand:- start:375 stop:875 length:501 start_codon:yes stop_codon:yes gene_type:complete